MVSFLDATSIRSSALEVLSYLNGECDGDDNDDDDDDDDRQLK